MSDESGAKQVIETQPFRLPSGESVHVRAIRPQDADGLQDYMRNLSAPTRHNRFLGAVSELTPAELERLTHMGGPREWAWIAFAHAGSTAIIAEAIQIVAPKAQCCEIALSVTDVWQRRGVATLLLATMECRARTLGARYLVGDVLLTNDAMRALARKAGFANRGPFRDARVIEIVKDLSSPQTRWPTTQSILCD